MYRLTCLLLLALLAVGCGRDDASDAKDDSSGTAPTATATVTVTASPEATEQEGILELGTTADVGFARITALKLDSEVPVDNFPSQKRWAAVLVRTCATADEVDGEPLRVGWGPWTVSDRADGLYQVTGVTGGITYPVPTYPLDPPQRLVKGQCVKGWIPFNVAPEARLASVTYASEAVPDPVTWRLN